MSQDLDQILVQQFLSDAHAEFQSQGFLLENAVRKKTGTKGSVVNFPVFGNGIANQKSPQDDVTPLDISSRNVAITLEDWYAAEYVDREFKNKIAVNAVQEYTSLCSYALGRRCDQQIIDVIVAANYGGGSGQGNSIAAGGTGLTYAKMRQGHRFLRQNSPNLMGQNIFLMDAEGEEDLLNESQLTSSDFVNKKAIDGNGLNGMELMGLKFIVIPSMAETGMPGSIAYMFNSMAVGYASEERLGGDISWENVKASYLINMWMASQAAVIDATGMVQINFA